MIRDVEKRTGVKQADLFKDLIARMMDLWRHRHFCSISARLYTSFGFHDIVPALKEWRVCVSSLARDDIGISRAPKGRASKDAELPDDLLPVVRRCIPLISLHIGESHVCLGY